MWRAVCPKAAWIAMFMRWLRHRLVLPAVADEARASPLPPREEELTRALEEAQRVFALPVCDLDVAVRVREALAKEPLGRQLRVRPMHVCIAAVVLARQRAEARRDHLEEVACQWAKASRKEVRQAEALVRLDSTPLKGVVEQIEALLKSQRRLILPRRFHDVFAGNAETIDQWNGWNPEYVRATRLAGLATFLYQNMEGGHSDCRAFLSMLSSWCENQGQVDAERRLQEAHCIICANEMDAKDFERDGEKIEGEDDSDSEDDSGAVAVAGAGGASAGAPAPP